MRTALIIVDRLLETSDRSKSGWPHVSKTDSAKLSQEARDLLGQLDAERASEEAEVDEFASTDGINTQWGFAGTIAGWRHISQADAARLFNEAAKLLGGGLAARKTLNSPNGRHFADQLTFDVDRDTATLTQVMRALKSSAARNDPSWFWRFRRQVRR